MEGQAILALLAVLALGMAVGGILVGAMVRAVGGNPAATAIPQLPTMDLAAVERVTKQVQDLAAVLKQMKG